MGAGTGAPRSHLQAGQSITAEGGRSVIDQLMVAIARFKPAITNLMLAELTKPPDDEKYLLNCILSMISRGD